MPSNGSDTDASSGGVNRDSYEYSIVYNPNLKGTCHALRKVMQPPVNTPYLKYFRSNIKPKTAIVAFLRWPPSALKLSDSRDPNNPHPNDTEHALVLLVTHFDGTGINIEKDRSNGKVDAIYVEL